LSLHHERCTTPEFYPLSLHDALPISLKADGATGDLAAPCRCRCPPAPCGSRPLRRPARIMGRAPPYACGAAGLAVGTVDAREPRAIVRDEAAAVAGQRIPDGGDGRLYRPAAPLARLAIGLAEVAHALPQAGPGPGAPSRVFRRHCQLPGLRPVAAVGHAGLPWRTYRVAGGRAS